MNKIIKRYKNIPTPAKASIWFAFCSAFQKGIMLLCTPLFTRLLTTEEYGIYTLYNSWFNILLIFATLNLFYGVYNNGLMKYEEDRKRFASTIQGLSFFVTLILLTLYILFRHFWEEFMGLSSFLILTMFAQFMFVPAFNFWSAEQRYDYKYVKLVIITLLMGALGPILGIIFVKTTVHKAEAITVAFAGVQILIGLVFFVRSFLRGRMFYKKEYWTFALKFNLPLVPHYLSMNILNQSDRIMISKMIGNGPAAIYGVAHSISLMMTIVTTAINNSFIPYTYKTIKLNDYKSLKKTANLLIVFIAFICILTMAFGPEIIRVFAASEYYDAIWVIPPLAASVFFMFLYPLFSNIEFYFEKTKYVMYVSCVSAVLNIVLNYCLMPYFGYYVTGYTTLFCNIISAIGHYYYHRKLIKENLDESGNIYDVRFIVLVSAILLVAMVGMTLVYKYILIRYGIIIALGVILVICRKKVMVVASMILKKN